MSEVWREIPGIPAYEVSEFGAVRRRSAHTRDGRPGKNLKPYRTKQGYFSVTMSGVTKGVHVLVALAFVGPRPDWYDAQVAHIDGTRDNNHFRNLRWTTAKGNADDRTRHGRSIGLKGDDHPNRVLSEDIVVEMREMRIAGFKFREISEATGFPIPTIHNAVTGKQWAHVKFGLK